jgi:hypothetical protein
MVHMMCFLHATLHFSTYIPLYIAICFDCLSYCWSDYLLYFALFTLVCDSISFGFYCLGHLAPGPGLLIYLPSSTCSDHPMAHALIFLLVSSSTHLSSILIIHQLLHTLHHHTHSITLHHTHRHISHLKILFLY